MQIMQISVVLNNIGITYATRASIGLPFSWSAPVVFITTFATFFFIVISIMKDISDIEGDMKHNIRTFPAVFGCRNATLFSTGILLVNYIGAIMAGIFMPQAFKWYLMVPVHAILALWLLFQARKLDKENYSQEGKLASFHCNLVDSKAGSLPPPFLAFFHPNSGLYFSFYLCNLMDPEEGSRSPSSYLPALFPPTK
ncbi:hypothetical protein TIFTF001_008221 [Ficus carica]|uniref:Uncharacterized protein n=1 Tax=Ficus carica TaxID=3494 RepID=A0AA88A4E5_FICCA|nr:hypothetical protein TIFTF001_008221 [Ficus carica]